MSQRTQQQRMRVLRDDSDQARINLDVAVSRDTNAEERDRAIRIGDAYATLALSDSIRFFATTVDAIFGEIAREWMVHKSSQAHRAPGNGAAPAGEGRKV
jgi:hypothetical protein